VMAGRVGSDGPTGSTPYPTLGVGVPLLWVGGSLSHPFEG